MWPLDGWGWGCVIKGMRIDSPGLVTDLDCSGCRASTVTDHGDHLVRCGPRPTRPSGGRVSCSVLGEARSAEVDRWVARFEDEFPDAGHRAVGFAQPGMTPAARGWEVEGDVDLATT